MQIRTRRLPAALVLGAVAAAAVAVSATGLVDGQAGWAATSPLPGLGTGRIWSLAASPAKAGLVIAGTDRGVYVTTDSGTTWSATTLSAVRVWAVGFDARDPTRLFAGTDGQGVEVSTDAGATWTPSSSGLQDLTVRTLAFSLDGIAAGTNRGVALSPTGSAWHDGGLDGYSISSLAVAASSPSLVLVAASDRGNLSGGYLFRYTGGVNWQTLQSGLPSAAVVSTVAAGPISSAVPKRPLVVTTSKGAFRSGDSGSTWTASTGVPDNLTLTTAAYSPLDPNLVYAGADQGSSNGGDLLRSTDGGATFTAADQGLRNQMREVESIAVEQTTPPAVLAALDPSSGGVTYAEVDSTAPAPPPLLAEAPGAPIPSTLATAAPTATASHAVTTTAPDESTNAGPVGAFFGSAFHWPMPLVLEVLLVLALAYVLVRWRQRYYVEGPP